MFATDSPSNAHVELPSRIGTTTRISLIDVVVRAISSPFKNNNINLLLTQFPVSLFITFPPKDKQSTLSKYSGIEVTSDVVFGAEEVLVRIQASVESTRETIA